MVFPQRAEQNEILKASKLLEMWNCISLLYVQEKPFGVELPNTKKKGISPVSRMFGMLSRS